MVEENEDQNTVKLEMPMGENGLQSNMQDDKSLGNAPDNAMGNKEKIYFYINQWVEMQQMEVQNLLQRIIK